MNMLRIIDSIVFPALALISVYLIFKFNWKGFLVAFLLVWLFPYCWGILVLSKFDTERTTMLDDIWLMAGWAASIIWCALVLLSGYLFKKIRRK